MDLISSIFDDKQKQRNKLQGKGTKKGSPPANKVKKATKSSVPDKKARTTNRNVSQNDQLNKHGKVKRCEEKQQFVQSEKVTEKKEHNDEEEEKVKTELRGVKETVDVDPSVIRNFSKYFQENDSIEDSFESALEVYNDCTFDEKDADFGRESFQSLDKDYFIEAYNMEGYELVQSSIQLSFDSVMLNNVEVPQGDGDQIVFISDDDADRTFVETYNSVGYELRKIQLQKQTGDEIEEESFVGLSRSFSSVSKKSTLSRTDSRSSAGSYTLIHPNEEIDEELQQEKYIQLSRVLSVKRSPSTNNTYRSGPHNLALKDKDQTKPENVIRKELQRQDSVEEPHFEVKSIQELIPETHSSILNIPAVSKVSRSSSSTSNKSTLSRVDSTNSTGSYILVPLNQYDDSVDTDDDVPSLKLSFEVKTKADMIIQELLETERSYIENLMKIKTDYIRYFKRMSRVKSAGMFGNILDILKETKSFFCSLLICGNDYEYIANTFKDYRHLFDLYPEYSKNKSSADQLLHRRFKPILQERQKCLGDKLDLASYLLTPVQRLGRYILLLKTLRKSVRKPECLDEAVRIVEKAMKKGNDYVAIDSILECDIDLTTKGSYIDREKFTLLKPRREEIVLFLFEQIVVFTYQELNAEKFSYKSSICLDDLQIINSEGDSQSFQLKNYTKSKKENQEQHTYTLEARSVKLRETWVQLIQNKLWEQLQQVKAQSKTYKVPDMSEKRHVKSTANASNLIKTKSTNNIIKRGRTASDRNSVKRNSKFYVDETGGYDTL